MDKNLKILLCGLPNGGKTSLLNSLSGLSLKTANYSGTTVAVSKVQIKIDNDNHSNSTIDIIDTPGFYNLTKNEVTNPEDENLSIEFIINHISDFDRICILSDGSNFAADIRLVESIFAKTDKSKVCIILNVKKNTRLPNLQSLLTFTTQNAITLVQADCLNKKDALQSIREVIKNQGIVLDVCKKNSISKSSAVNSHYNTKSEKILTHRVFGLPIFFAILFVSLFTAFTLGGFLSDKILALANLITPSGSSSLAILLTSTINGMFVIFGFIPIIFFVFLFVTIFEKTGYITRVSYLLNGFMLKFCKMDGKAFIPLLTGIGCTVPAYMATRILPNKHQRFLANTMLSFIPCSAKNTVFALFCSGLLGGFYGSLALYSIYVFGFIFGLIVIKIISLFVKQDLIYASSAYQIHPMQLPHCKDILHVSYTKVREYIVNIATTILMFSIVFSLCNTLGFSFNQGFYVASAKNAMPSILELISKFLLPIFAPIDLPWQIIAAIIAGFIAKEVSLSMLAVLLSVNIENGDNIAMAMTNAFEPRIILQFLVFMFFYAPCISAMSTLQKEGRSFKQTGFIFVLTSFLAYGGAYLVKILY